MKRLAIRLLAGISIFLVLAVAVGWLAFVPGAKEPGYEFVIAWGGKGSGPGQFNDPTGLAVAGDEVFVADSRNGRVQVFDFNGNFKRQFGQPGNKPGDLKRPMNLDRKSTRLNSSHIPLSRMPSSA